MKIHCGCKTKREKLFEWHRWYAWYPIRIHDDIFWFEYLIKTYTNEGDLVLDNCAGSFTTAIASDNLKRNWICIEKEAEYCAIGEKRIKENRERLRNIDNCAKLDI